MKRVALSSFLHETNTFSPIQTTQEMFNKNRRTPDQVITDFKGKKINSALTGFFKGMEDTDIEVVPLISYLEVEPSGMVPEKVFYKVLDEIVEDIKAKGPFDAIYMDLHGAMVFGDYKDGEEETIRKVLEAAGDIPFVASLDTHANMNRESFELASGLVVYRTYPHVDIDMTGYRCAKLITHLLSGKPCYKAMKLIPFLMPVSSMPSNVEPTKSLYDSLAGYEEETGVVSVSFIQGFPSADMPEMGPSVLAYAETQEKADEVVQRMYDDIMEKEELFVSSNVDVNEAVSRAIKLAANNDKPVILADVVDNAGGGSSSDTTGILQELIEKDAKNVALGLMYDPAAAEKAHQAGVGAKIKLSLGGKLLPGHKPVEGEFEVMSLNDGEFVCTGPMMGGYKFSLGKMAQLKIGGILIAVSSVRTQMLDQQYFRQVGINPAEMDILVIKSSNHYRADFQPISCEIINVFSPAGTVENPARADYKLLREGVRLYGGGPAFEK